MENQELYKHAAIANDIDIIELLLKKKLKEHDIGNV